MVGWKTYFYHRRATGSDAFHRWASNSIAAEVKAARVLKGTPPNAFDLLRHVSHPTHVNVMAQGPLATKAQVDSYVRYKAAYAAVGITVEAPPPGGAAAKHLRDDDEWEEECHVCGKGGSLLCCALCPHAAHKKCYGLKAQPKGDWRCEDCSEEEARGLAPADPAAFRTGFESDSSGGDD